MSRPLPSTRWTSFEDWNYNGMEERLKGLLAKLNKVVLLDHAARIKGQHLTMSEPFSAGQYWICFEMVAEDDSIIIARVRLPPHPDALSTVNEDEEYSIACEISAMSFVREKLPNVPLPRVFAYERPGSQLATSAGATYMLIEGFRGNTLSAMAPDFYSLSVGASSFFLLRCSNTSKDSKQQRVIAQWTMIQATLATLTNPLIGSISGIAETGEPIIDRLSSAVAEGFTSQGPFSNPVEYFTALGTAALNRANGCNGGVDERLLRFRKLGALVFIDIVNSTALFQEFQVQYPFNHMDLGTQNIIVDDDLTFLAVIDWEFAQTAPREVNHYPMPFPLLWSDQKIKDILDDATHVAHKNVTQQVFTRQLYRDCFRVAETELEKKGASLGVKFADVLESAASRVHACFSKLGDSPEHDEVLVREMVRLAFNYDDEGTDQYLKKMSCKIDLQRGN
ncbi:hypothetical protein BFJ68_g16998 [Fusarium oxysporum]|uniref:Uncharacterized protein n=1 Tax=Fusarium oxysporum TaxID=5507 RepID=A0A420P5U2_FUSOX|nr:hypothetical protein BFJ68_g16998 [Fusarium oxysporum]